MEIAKDISELPIGWKRKEVVRKNGINKGKIDIYMTSPRGKIFRSKRELARYIDVNKLSLNIENFNFSTKRISRNTSISSENKINETFLD